MRNYKIKDDSVGASFVVVSGILLAWLVTFVVIVGGY